MDNIETMPAVFVNHGGGPMPLMNPKQHQEMYDHLRSISQAYPNPKAIVIISAHW
jgi:aromatic ring-opening dioxygenase catalytic subunit (LigB family)